MSDEYVRERLKLNDMLADPAEVSMRIRAIEESFRPRTREDSLAECVASAYVQARFRAGGRPPSRAEVEGIARSNRADMLRIAAFCADNHLPIIDYIAVACARMRGKPLYFNTLTSDTGLKWWREHNGDVARKPDMDEYATGLAAVRDAMRRMAWAKVGVEDVIVMMSGALPLGYLIESPTARRLARDGRLYPERLNIILSGLPDNAHLKGDGV